MMIITLSADPGELLTAWHNDADEGFDFSAGPSRIEVKSFTGEGRIHNFSLRQARPGAGIDVIVASLRAERSAGGASVSDLMLGLISRQISDDLLEKAERVIAESLGETAGTALSLTFDMQRAQESLRFFDAHSVPAVEPPLPDGVVNVRFESLLREAHALKASDLSQRLGLFGALLLPPGDDSTPPP
jgi:hypothetical protein